MSTRQIVINIFVLGCFLIVNSHLTYSQQSWIPTNDFPNEQALNIFCIAKDFGWGNITVGGEVSQRNIFTSTDDGNSWINLGPHPSGGIYAIAQEQSMLGRKYCVIRDYQNSNNNGIYRRDNAYGWQLVACKDLDVRSVVQRYGTVLASCRNTGRGIYRSTNDGDTWSQIYSNADIYCFDAKNNIMYAGGAYTSGAGILLKSTSYPFDTWLEVEYFDGYVIGLWVTENGNIWVATHKNKIYRSINGGNFNIVKNDVNWDELKIPITSNFSNQVFVGDYQTGIWYTTDDGANWDLWNSGLPNLHITDLAINPINQSTLYTSLGNSLSYHIYKLNTFIQPDSCVWIPQYSGTNEGLRDVYFLNADTGYVVGGEYVPTILKTIDGGNNWNDTTFSTGNFVASICFTDETTGYAVGGDDGTGTIFKTTDGNTWNVQIYGNNRFYSVCFPDKNTGYAAGVNHTIIKTTDAGKNWTSLEAGTSSWFSSIFFINVDTGYVTGEKGTILKTTNGGNSWIGLSSGTDKWINCIYFISQDTGYAVGQDGIILRTTNGGDYWNLENSGTIRNLSDVFFVNKDTGYVVGDAGLILRTTDGGISWNPQNSGIENALSAIFFVNSDLGYIVGSKGIILKYAVKSINVPPNPPTLISPTNKSYINDATPQLHWSVPHDTNGDLLHFKVEVAMNSGFTSYISSSPFESKSSTIDFNPTPPVAQGSGSCSYTLQSTLDDGTYYWRVSAWDDYVYGTASEIYNFTVDTTPPTTYNHIPAKNATNVAVNSNVVVHVQDALSGVKKSSIVMRVNGDSISPTITGTSSDYSMTYNPEPDFGYNRTITVSVDVEDNAGNKMTTDTYSFSTVSDLDPPYTASHNPLKNAQDVPRNTNIVVHVKDDGSGVNQSSIVMKVKGVQVTPTITGNYSDFTLTYDPPNDFGYQETINVSIDATDIAGNQMSTDSYSFTTASETNTAAQSPTLESPSDNSYINDNTPQLSWSVPIDANGDQLHFKVEIDDDHNWSNIFRTIESKTSTTGFSPTPPVNQGTGSISYVVQSSLSEGDWWWRVAAWDGHVYGSYSVERKFTVDVTKPYTSNHNPAKDTTGVATNTNIVVNIQDVLSGVKQSNIVMKVNGNTVSPTITGTASNYTLTYNPANDFNYNQTVTVSIDAGDNAGNIMDTDSYSFTTISSGDQTAPEINHSAVSIADSGQSITILAMLTDNVGIQQAALYYRQGGKINYTIVIMNKKNSDYYEANIPSNEVRELGLEYYISVSDLSGNIKTYPENDPLNNPQVIRVHSSNLIRSGKTAKKSYQMISVPIDLDDSRPLAVLKDDLGKYDDTKWRLFCYVDGESVEFNHPKFYDFEPGKGFWLITKDEEQIDSGAGSSVSTNHSYPITLLPGWNQIGNPFAFSVDWSDVKKGSGVEDKLVGYDDSGYDYNRLQMKPWEGYFVKNHNSISTTIEIPVKEATFPLAKEKANELAIHEFQDNEWGIQITAQSEHYLDKDNYFGCIYDAADEWDHHDFSEAPFFDRYVSLYFPHEDWKMYPGLYTGDFRSVKYEGEYWDFCVKTNVLNYEIILNLQDMQNIPSDWNIFLLDKTSQLTIDFLEQKRYTFYKSKAEQVREFRIFVGAKKFIDKNNLEITEIPQRYELMQNYPNPFNSETQIKYFIPISGWVNLSVYSIIGQKIRSLVNSYQGAGSYTVSWDGSTESGNIVSSGIYLIN